MLTETLAIANPLVHYVIIHAFLHSGSFHAFSYITGKRESSSLNRTEASLLSRNN